MSKRQESILSAFSRQQEASAKRRKTGAGEVVASGAVTVRRRRAGLERFRAANAHDEGDDDADESGSVTDGDLFSSQEDVHFYGRDEVDGGSEDNASHLGVHADASCKARASMIVAFEAQLPCEDDSLRAVAGERQKVRSYGACAGLLLSSATANTPLHTQKEVRLANWLQRRAISMLPLRFIVTDALLYCRSTTACTESSRLSRYACASSTPYRHGRQPVIISASHVSPI